MDPLPHAVTLGRAHDLDAGNLKLATRGVHVVDLEERDGPVRMLAEEVVVGSPGAMTWIWSPSEVVNSTVVGSSKLTFRPRMSRRKPTIAS